MYTLKSLSFPHLRALDLALVMLSILYCQWKPDDCWKILCVRCSRHSRHIASTLSIVNCRLMEAETPDPPFLYFSGEKIWYEDRKIRPIHRFSPNPLQTALPQTATSLYFWAIPWPPLSTWCWWNHSTTSVLVPAPCFHYVFWLSSKRSLWSWVKSDLATFREKAVLGRMVQSLDPSSVLWTESINDLK